MKTKWIFFLAFFSLISLENAVGQDKDNNQTVPETKYNVHRQYDENGNLIEYDSSSVSTWEYSGTDSLSDFWSYTPYPADSNEFNYGQQHHYGFRFPGDDYPEFPYFNFGFDFHDLDSLMQGFNFNFSMSPPDSLQTKKDPYFQFHGEFPYMNRDIESYIRQMQQIMDEMISDHKQFFKDFDEPYINPPQPLPPAPDSINPPPVSAPKPEPQKYSGPIQNI